MPDEHKPLMKVPGYEEDIVMSTDQASLNVLRIAHLNTRSLGEGGNTGLIRQLNQLGSHICVVSETRWTQGSAKDQQWQTQRVWDVMWYDNVQPVAAVGESQPLLGVGRTRRRSMTPGRGGGMLLLVHKDLGLSPKMVF